jgi:hypothetical protein
MTNVPDVTPEELKAALPLFQAGLRHTGPKEEMSWALKIRCAIANYLLHGEGELEDRVCKLVAGMPMDVNNAPKDLS